MHACLQLAACMCVYLFVYFHLPQMFLLTEQNNETSCQSSGQQYFAVKVILFQRCFFSTSNTFTKRTF